MTDIVNRLRDRAYCGKATDALCEEAANEIERLRKGAVESRETVQQDRDTFAAAALTGLLAAPTDKDRSSEYWARFSYAISDAMLRERGDTPASYQKNDEKRGDAPTKREVDIVTRLRQTRANMIGTDDEDHFFDCHDAAGEIDRLRSRVWETPRTQPPHATYPQGSVPGEGSFLDSRNAKEPVAWWLKGAEYDTGCEYEYVSLVKESADAAAKNGGTVTPLYRSPTLTDAEREAVELAIDCMNGVEDISALWSQRETEAIATLRGLLERTK